MVTLISFAYGTVVVIVVVIMSVVLGALGAESHSMLNSLSFLLGPAQDISL